VLASQILPQFSTTITLTDHHISIMTFGMTVIIVLNVMMMMMMMMMMMIKILMLQALMCLSTMYCTWTNLRGFI